MAHSGRRTPAAAMLERRVAGLGAFDFLLAAVETVADRQRSWSLQCPLAMMIQHGRSVERRLRLAVFAALAAADIVWALAILVLDVVILLAAFVTVIVKADSFVRQAEAVQYALVQTELESVAGSVVALTQLVMIVAAVSAA